MSNIFSKLRDFVGLNEPVDYDYEYDESDGSNYQSLYPSAPDPSAAATPLTAAVDPRAGFGAVSTPNFNAGSPDLNTPMNSSAMTGSSNVIGLPGVGNISEVVVMEPKTFEEMPQAIQALRERKSVVLNLTVMDPEQAQRAVDFIAGGTYALDGHQERIGESIFLFTPNCVQVSTQAGVVHEATAGNGAMRSPRPPVTVMSSAPSWTTDFGRSVQS